MAGEVAFDFRAGATCYFQVRNRTSGFVWNGSAFEVYASTSGALNSYAVSVTEQGASAHYVGNMPSAIPAGVYDVTAKQKINAYFAEADPTVAAGEVQWNGTLVPPLSDTATSGQVGQLVPVKLARGVMVQNFPFKMVSQADHVTPFTSGVVSGQISRDGAAFGALQSGAFTEMGLGWYKLSALTSGDLNANTVALVLTAAGVSGGLADQRDFAFVLQRVSGY